MDGGESWLVMVHQVIGHGRGTPIALQRPRLIGDGIEFSTGISFQFVKNTQWCARRLDVFHLVAAIVERPEFRHIIIDVWTVGRRRPEERRSPHPLLVRPLPDCGHGYAVGIPVADARRVLVPQERAVVEYPVPCRHLAGDKGGVRWIGGCRRHTDYLSYTQALLAHHLQEWRGHERVVHHLGTQSVDGDEDDVFRMNARRGLGPQSQAHDTGHQRHHQP